MEEQNEVLVAMKHGFERIDQRFERIDLRLGRIEEDMTVLKKDTHEGHLKLEFLIAKAELIKENVVDMRTYMARYHTDVEHPLEERVTRLEARIGILEQEK
jgi:hypothetical protein